MDNLAEILKYGRTQGPYPKATRVLIADKEVQANEIILGLADDSTAAKAICYDKNLDSRLIVGNTVLLRNFQKGRSNIFLTKNTHVIPSLAFQNLPATLVQQAKDFVHPPSPAMRKLAEVTSGAQGLITITAEVIQDELPHQVPSGQDVRNIKLKQDETTMAATLWNSAATSPIKTGDTIQITHAVARDDKFLKQLVLSSTSHSVVTVKTPQPRTVHGRPVAAQTANNNEGMLLTVLTDEGNLIDFHLDDMSPPEEKLASMADKTYVFTAEGSRILSIDPEHPEPGPAKPESAKPEPAKPELKRTPEPGPAKPEPAKPELKRTISRKK